MYPANGKKRLILEVDLEYPEELHDLHNEYPLVPEQVKVTENMLSPYCREIKDRFKVSVGIVHKLIPTLLSKEKYVLHMENLKQYLELGLNVKKVQRALEFDQSPWLKRYSSKNPDT